MLPQFFDSVLQLIVKTSTDLPPDVRAAVKSARDTEEAGSRSAQALTIVAQNIDQAAEVEGAICQDTGMPTFEIKTPVGANQIWMKQQIKAAVAEATRLGKLRPELRRFADRRELRQQPRPRHADPALRAVGTRRDRSEADPEGRRLREHERAVLAADGAAAPGPRRPHDGRRAQVPAARRVAGAGQGLRPRRHWRLHRRRPHQRLRRSQAATVPHAGRCERGRAAGRARSRHHADREHARRGHHGLWRQGVADRLQGRRAQPPARQLLRVGGLRLLGVPPARRGARRVRPAPSSSGSIATRRWPRCR